MTDRTQNGHSWFSKPIEPLAYLGLGIPTTSGDKNGKRARHGMIAGLGKSREESPRENQTGGRLQ
jgi:hypothetical protein